MKSSSKQSSLPGNEGTASSFEIVGGVYKLVNKDHKCRHCGSLDSVTCFPGEFAKCYRCGFILLYLGRVPSAECVTPSGMVNQHGRRGMIIDGEWVCGFCKRSTKGGVIHVDDC